MIESYFIQKTLLYNMVVQLHNFIYHTFQDLFVHKVRQFHFEIQRLFGSSKPFSCDVVVRHSDQITVLPIEVDMQS